MERRPTLLLTHPVHGRPGSSSAVNVSSRTGGIVAASVLTVPPLTACSTSSGSAAGAAAVPSGGTSAAQGTQALQHLDVTSSAALATTPGTVVLDVRTAEEFATGHLAGARNVDFRAADLTGGITAWSAAGKPLTTP